MRQHQRPRYGFYVDHVVDVFGAAFLLGGLALSGYMHPYVALSLLSVYLMLCVEVFLATHCLGTFTMSFMKVGPTELRILLAVGNVALWFRPNVHLFGQTYRLFDVGGVIGTVGLLATLVISAWTNGRALYKAEPIPR